MAEAPINLVISAEYDRISIHYGRRGIRYAMIEAGYIGQNIFLMAESLDLGAGIVGTFNDEQVIRVLNLSHTQGPLLIVPIGPKRSQRPPVKRGLEFSAIGRKGKSTPVL